MDETHLVRTERNVRNRGRRIKSLRGVEQPFLLFLSNGPFGPLSRRNRQRKQRGGRCEVIEDVVLHGEEGWRVTTTLSTSATAQRPSFCRVERNARRTDDGQGQIRSHRACMMTCVSFATCRSRMPTAAPRLVVTDRSNVWKHIASAAENHHQRISTTERARCF